ncbi:MAG: hypothetical protein PHE89_01450 [Alphaproteobacteria bacterium]|nr:hypothetical protein [Alphaproteobacteria bacterium]
MLTDLQIKDIAAILLKNNSTLCSEVFRADNFVKKEIREKILEIANFHLEKISSFMVGFEVEDIVLCGGITGHIYNDYTDIDVCIILKHQTLDKDSAYLKEILKKLNSTLSNIMQPVRIYSRRIDIGVINYLDQGSGTYSLLKNEWLSKPLYRKFPFTMKEFVLGYMEYEQEIDQFMIGLEKLSSNFLTAQSCQKAERYLLQLKEKTLKEKSKSEEKEYGLKTNFYRFFAKSGKLEEIRNYIADSYSHIVNVLEKRDE